MPPRLLWLTGAVLSALLVAGLGSSLAWGLVAGLLVLALFQFIELVRFNRWSRRALRRPHDDWSWGEGAARIHRLVRAARVRARRFIEILRQVQRTADAIPDGLVVLRASGEIEYYNRGARNLLGLLPSDRGENLFVLIRNPHIQALVSGDVESGLVEMASPADARRQIELRRIELDGSQHILIARDVTELNRLLTLRRDFVANVSHELRTPLTVILGYLESLNEDQLDEQQRREALARLERPVHRMRALTEDLLTLTALESSPGPDESKLVGVVVARILGVVVDEARNLSKVGHEILLEADENLVIEGVGDELFSAFLNLVVNAVRYSPDGGRIRVRWYRSSEGAVFEVEDQGMGIAPEHLSRLTERFYRVDLRGSRVRGGTGLGLAIVKHVLRRHDSVLDIESELGKGSRFSCVFPQIAVTRIRGLGSVGSGAGSIAPASY